VNMPADGDFSCLLRQRVSRAGTRGHLLSHVRTGFARVSALTSRSRSNQACPLPW
jgi:hypothetical protein